MPRQKKTKSREPKKRSRKGCWPCKARKVKCGEEHPACMNCQKSGEVCDYSVRLNWSSRYATKSFVEEEDNYDNSRPSYKPIQLRPHELSVEINQASDGSVQALGGAESHTDRAVVFVDESHELLNSFGLSEGNNAKRRLEHSPATAWVSSVCRGSQMTSPALGTAGHKRIKSFAGMTELDKRQAESTPCPSETRGSTSSSHWVSYPNVLDGLLTPTLSSQSGDIVGRSNWAALPSLESPDSCISGNGGSDNSPSHSGHMWEGPRVYGLHETPSNLEVFPCGDGTFYGYDSGIVDEDLLESDDANTVVLLSPAAHNSAHGVVDLGEEAVYGQRRVRSSGLNQSYYENLVPVVIPWALEPLPDIIEESKMNLLYFHHFLNHTSQVLVPYHDASTNPLQTQLAVMALKSRPLMSLILAFSACHRSQLLGTSLPQMRMAEWAQSIFPALRVSLFDSSSPSPDVTLAMTVMLIALEIMSPGAFGRGISWREHVVHARGPLTKRLDQNIKDATMDGMGFIRSWLGYVDVMGDLMAGPRLALTCKSRIYFPLPEPHRCADALDEIDCIMGISVKCAHLLSQVAELARQCQGERFRLDGQLLHGWCPQPAMVKQALFLEQYMMESVRQSSRPCSHVRTGSIRMRDLAEMAAMNEAFHWAGLIQLHRRVLGKATDHPDIQVNVRNIMQCLEEIKIRGVAETRCLFPIFTAGCEALTECHRTKLVGRLANAEKSGMNQVHAARLLLEQVWTTGKTWEELICNEFIA